MKGGGSNKRGELALARSIDRSLSIDELESILDHLIQRYGVSYSTISKIAKRRENERFLLPASIFKDRSKTIIEIAFSYLRNHYGLLLDEICSILKIDLDSGKILWDRNFQVDTSYTKPLVPASIFSSSNSFENLVLYLKEKKGLKNFEIARILNRNNKTIWTAYERVRRKSE